MKKIISMALTVCMVLSMVVTAFAVAPAGEIIQAYLNPSNGRLVVDLRNLEFSESVVLRVHSGNKVLTTSELNTAKYSPGSYSEFTGAITVNDKDPSSSWNVADWEPNEKYMPNKIELVVDGNSVDSTSTIYYDIPEPNGYKEMTAENWANFEGVTKAAKGRIIRAWLREEKGRIMVDLADIVFNESVALELYSGSEKLTTANLNTNEYKPGSWSEFTGSITINDKDPSDTWPVENWQPMDNKVPDKVVLVVDGEEMDFTNVIFNGNPDHSGSDEMDSNDWENFEGTIAPVGGNVIRAWLREEKGRITVDMENVTFYESAELWLYSGSNVLTKAKLDTTKVAPGTHAELTGSINVNDKDPSTSWIADAWNPMDDVIPDRVVLMLDGEKIDEVTTIFNGNPDMNNKEEMSGEHWADFEGVKDTTVVVPPAVDKEEEDEGDEDEEEEGESLSVRVKFDGVKEKEIDEIKVYLLKNGKRYKSTTLKDRNDWYYKWTGLPEGRKIEYSVEIKGEPEGYDVAVKNVRGNYWTLTISAEEVEENKGTLGTVDKENPETGAGTYGYGSFAVATCALGVVCMAAGFDKKSK